MVIGTRFTVEEAALIDKERASMSRAEYLRWLFVSRKKPETPHQQ